MNQHQAMIDRSHSLSVLRQARELGGSRSSVYYLPAPVSSADLGIMLRDLLRQEGIEIGRCHVATLMKQMAIEAIYPRPNTSKPAPGHKIYPYLLRKLPIMRPNQVWATDISYIPMAKGFVYLVAIVDWFSRKVLSHRVSITMEADFCVEALEEALARYGKPEIFNTDQGSHGPRQDRRWAWAWSPEQIAKRLLIDFPNDETMRICHEASRAPAGQSNSP